MFQNLKILRQLFPIKGAIVVGAGLGEGPWIDLFKKINDGNILLIEAQEDRVKQLEAIFVDYESWHVKQHVVAEEEGESDFFVVANLGESSLLSPDELSELWPNVKLKHQYISQTIALDKIVEREDFEINWLVVDCLPSMPILHGAEKLLSDVDAFVVRMLINEQPNNKHYSSMQDIDEFMQRHSFLRVSLEKEHHPALGYGIYVRDYGRLYQREVERIAEHEKKSDELRCKLREIQDKSEKQKKQLKELQASNDSANKCFAESRARAEKLSKELSTLVKDQDNISITLGELKKKNQELLHEKEVLNEELENLRQQLRTEKQKGHDHSLQLQQEHEYRQQLIDQEVLKAEAQLELMKDILIRDKAF